jgi:hypothetical protein
VKTKWLVYTVLPALIPVGMRLLVLSLATTPPSVSWFQPTDVAAFGLVIAITNITVLEHARPVDRRWKGTNIGLSVILLVFLSGIFALSSFSALAPEAVSEARTLGASLGLSAGCLTLSYQISDRLELVARAAR